MQPEPEPEPAPPAIGADSAIHYSDGTSAAQSAPSLAAFEALVAGGEVTGASIVWVEGWQGWVPLAECAQRLGLRGGAAHSSLVELESIRVPREAVEGAAAVGDEAAAEKIQALARGWSARQRRTREVRRPRPAGRPLPAACSPARPELSRASLPAGGSVRADPGADRPPRARSGRSPLTRVRTWIRTHAPAAHPSLACVVAVRPPSAGTTRGTPGHSQRRPSRATCRRP